MECVWLVFISEKFDDGTDETMDSVHSVHKGEETAVEMVESLSRPVYGFNHVWSERWTLIQ